MYGLFLWAAPDARKMPETTKDDILACIPVAFCSAAAHSFSVFGASLPHLPARSSARALASGWSLPSLTTELQLEWRAALSAGAVSFGQIVKAAEPAFAALLGLSSR